MAYTLDARCEVKGLTHSQLGGVVVSLINVGGCAWHIELLEAMAIVGDIALDLHSGTVEMSAHQSKLEKGLCRMSKLAQSLLGRLIASANAKQ